MDNGRAGNHRAILWNVDRDLSSLVKLTCNRHDTCCCIVVSIGMQAVLLECNVYLFRCHLPYLIYTLFLTLICYLFYADSSLDIP